MKIKPILSLLDQRRLLGFQVWDFGFHSFFKEYAWFFFFRAMLRYPAKTVLGLLRYRKFIGRNLNLFTAYERELAIPSAAGFSEVLKRSEKKPLMGLGFCLKPSDPNHPSLSCPSGRSNHDCLFLKTGKTLAMCTRCAIREIASKSLETGCPVYVMTSARDIADDFLIPQIDRGEFSSAILLLCPYSVQAILPSLFICRIDSFLLAYSSGYCRDYSQWRRADIGQKPERTDLNADAWMSLWSWMERIPKKERPSLCFHRRGNIFYPTQDSPLK